MLRYTRKGRPPVQGKEGHRAIQRSTESVSYTHLDVYKRQILTGVILAMSRIIGETAPLVVVGAATFITTCLLYTSRCV